MRVAGPAIAAAGLAVALLTAPPAAGQEECSCTDKDPTTSVELQITAAVPEDYSRIGPEQEALVVDLRGQQTVLVGDAPELLAGADLAEVPVLMVVENPSTADECSELRPAAGTDLSLTGHVYLEETGPVVWTGPCQGTLTIEAATPAATARDEDTWGRGLAISAAVLAGLAILSLALVPLAVRRHDRAAPPGPASGS